MATAKKVIAKKLKDPLAPDYVGKKSRIPAKTKPKAPLKSPMERKNWEPSNIWEALLAFQKERISIPRNGRGKSASGTEYKYATLDDTLNTALPLLQKYGIGFTQIISGGKLITDLFHAASRTNIVSEMDLAKPSSMQSYGGNVTYAKRYAFTALTGLSTDEDTDAVPTPDVPDKAIEPKVQDSLQGTSESKPETVAETVKELEKNIDASLDKMRSEPFKAAADKIGSCYSGDAIDIVRGKIKASERLSEIEKVDLLAIADAREAEVEGTVR